MTYIGCAEVVRDLFSAFSTGKLRSTYVLAPKLKKNCKGALRQTRNARNDDTHLQESKVDNERWFA